MSEKKGFLSSLLGGGCGCGMSIEEVVDDSNFAQETPCCSSVEDDKSKSDSKAQNGCCSSQNNK